MKYFLKIVIYGYLLLLLALLINFLATHLNLVSWYQFLTEGLGNGNNIINLIWLFIFYPLSLGVSVWLATWVEKKLNKLNSKQILLFLASFFLVLSSLIIGYHFWSKEQVAEINSFKECQEAGFPVAEKFPEECFLPDGRSFTRELKEDEKVVCTMDVKECPDGSFVGRIPPDCEFLPCPEES